MSVGALRRITDLFVEGRELVAGYDQDDGKKRAHERCNTELPEPAATAPVQCSICRVISFPSLLLFPCRTSLRGSSTTATISLWLSMNSGEQRESSPWKTLWKPCSDWRSSTKRMLPSTCRPWQGPSGKKEHAGWALSPKKIMNRMALPEPENGPAAIRFHHSRGILSNRPVHGMPPIVKYTDR